jgi:mono/diheme cytochrome c family protein
VAHPPESALVRGFALLALLAVSGCASGRRSEAVLGPLEPQTRSEQHGQLVFFQFCHRCHPAGDAGLGPAINNKPLPDFMIRLQVRKGAGSMPAFEERDISDRQLEDLLAYIELLKSHGD